jgi:hypothetical protein
VGVYQADALQNITASIVLTGTTTASSADQTSGALASEAYSRPDGQMGGNIRPSWKYSFDASRVVRTSSETRGAAARVGAYVLV